MRLFNWIGPAGLPAACDLRQLGWRLDDADGGGPQNGRCPVLADHRSLAVPGMLSQTAEQARQRARLLLFGIDDGAERARLIGLGIGDIVPSKTSLAEIGARAARLADLQALGKLVQWIGPLRLDLLARDGFVDGRRLGLHPREFSLLWRLADCPGAEVTARELLCDVWNLANRPETNSLAVHISRLRSKLRIVGLADMLVSTRQGYLLADATVCNSGLDLLHRIADKPVFFSKDQAVCVTI